MGRYEARIVAIQARLEQGTEKNNPRLRQRWDQAHHFLAQAMNSGDETYEALVTIKKTHNKSFVSSIPSKQEFNWRYLNSCGPKCGAIRL